MLKKIHIQIIMFTRLNNVLILGNISHFEYNNVSLTVLQVIKKLNLPTQL